MTSLTAGAVALLMTLGAVGASAGPAPDRAGVVPSEGRASSLSTAESRPAAGSAPEASARPARASPRIPPVPGPLVRRFAPPAHDYAPGHRGVDLAARPGQAVVSPTEGVVQFAGPVAGRGVVVVAHGGATVTALEPVSAALPVGAAVRRGQVVAHLADSPRHDGCASTCVHWGVRVQGRYVDPWWWLDRYGPVRLLPLSDR